MDPESIFFTQNAISAFFRCGTSIESAIYDIADSQVWHLPPIRLTMVGERYFSLDNRRLAVAKILRSWDFLAEVPCRHAGECQEELARKYDTLSDGKLVQIRRSIWTSEVFPFAGLRGGCRIEHWPRIDLARREKYERRRKTRRCRKRNTSKKAHRTGQGRFRGRRVGPEKPRKARCPKQRGKSGHIRATTSGHIRTE